MYQIICLVSVVHENGFNVDLIVTVMQKTFNIVCTEEAVAAAVCCYWGAQNQVHSSNREVYYILYYKRYVESRI